MYQEAEGQFVSSSCWRFNAVREINRDRRDAIVGKQQVATFAGGCFWCMVSPFDVYDGVKEVISGYTGGHKEHPTYEDVKAGATGHMEAVQISFDPDVISYGKLLDLFWQQIDPTDGGGQFVDRGRSYQTAVFYHSEDQRRIAEASKRQLAAKFNLPIATEILPAETFWPAEEHHQDFYKKNPGHYKAYRRGSGRDDYIDKVWQKDDQK